MNRFNLFFMFVSALISSALHYSISEEEKLKQELRAILYPRQHIENQKETEVKKTEKAEPVSTCINE